MMDISFVQDHLLTSEQQLELFKESLDDQNSNNLYTFNWVSNIENLKLRDMLRLDLVAQLDSFFDIKEYLNLTVERMLKELSFTLTEQFEKRNDKTVNIFLPTNLPYIIPSRYGQRLYLNGTIEFYFNN